MNPLLIIVAVIAVVLLITGGLVQSLQFLLWVGIVLAIIAVIMFLMRSISGRKSA
jgi:Zn-dependent membrane protease YugP